MLALPLLHAVPNLLTAAVCVFEVLGAVRNRSDQAVIVETWSLLSGAADIAEVIALAIRGAALCGAGGRY